MYSKEEMCAAFFGWVLENVPDTSESDGKNIKVEFRNSYGGASISIKSLNTRGKLKWIASVDRLDYLTLEGHNARYLALGCNDDTEVKIGDVKLVSENAVKYKDLFEGVEPVGGTDPFSGAAGGLFINISGNN